MLVLIGVLVCAAHATAQSPVPETDNQSWNDLQITVPMTKKVDFTTQVTLRLGDNVTQTVDQRWGIGFVFKPNKYLNILFTFIVRRGLQTGGMSLKIEEHSAPPSGFRQANSLSLTEIGSNAAGATRKSRLGATEIAYRWSIHSR